MTNLTQSPAEVLEIGAKVSAGERINFDEAMTLLEKADLFDLASLANQIRMAKHPDLNVTYVVDRNINYSNICSCGCKFCAFYVAPGQDGGFVISREELAQKLQETVDLGGTQILMQGGHNPDLPLTYYEDMLRFIKDNYPIHIHAFSPPEIVYFSELEGISVKEVLRRLIDAGLASIPGGGAEILVDEVRSRIAPNKCTTEQWLGVMETAHNMGIRTTATMMFGHEEQPADRIKHLLALREVQDRTSGFTAFIPWTFQPDNTNIPNARRMTSVEYLRLLAVSRIVLDNFDNVQVSWVTMGPKISQLALSYGGNDFGSTMIEENVVKAAGVSFRLSENEIADLITKAGFIPKQRSMDYTLMESRNV
ncbi:de-hypoxanthine futalosine cyclase [Maridesulfovibrio ferrireducens]|uniref:Cyclic dehypoxanthine futalosine synthase n=1 Tax=Maridesulfovibrio ferrireducens TaxID=246191 RepID=A0A1G9F574_9BACT|nr:cyclic dehypoxanthinyl futalosine synthase [Maridesulfovibrio ferrireducens]SDK83557.1 de-hypoxanthine futalosine cyclase [Maridesulfovibrio ferrireducens]